MEFPYRPPPALPLETRKRVRRIGKDIVEHYNGDARKIWKNQTPDEILERLMAMRVGPQISRMIIGALYDTEQISEAGDLKADTHVRRVLGRVFAGNETSAEDAHRIANKMMLRTSWRLDEPLYRLGQSKCKKTNPGLCELLPSQRVQILQGERLMRTKPCPATPRRASHDLNAHGLATRGAA